MVRGRSCAVTNVADRYQCADTQTIAFGFGLVLPIVAHALVHPLLWTAFIGFPCPKKMAGIDFVMVILLARPPGHLWHPLPTWTGAIGLRREDASRVVWRRGEWRSRRLRRRLPSQLVESSARDQLRPLPRRLAR